MNTKERLSKREVERLFYALCVAVSEMNNPKEVAELLRDLMSYHELKMIAKRLKIAEMVLMGKTYEEVRDHLKVGYGKIARVHEWINMSGEGYRNAIKKSRGKTEKPIELETEKSDWYSIKRKYPMYYWPELLLENIIENSNKRQKAKIETVMRELEKSKQKSALHKRIARLLAKR